MSLPPSEIPLGAMRFNSDSQKLEYWMGSAWMQIKTFSPNLDGGARGLFWWWSYIQVNKYNMILLQYPQQGNAQDFGDMTLFKKQSWSFFIKTRGCMAVVVKLLDVLIQIDFVTISSTGNATDFGDKTHIKQNSCGCFKCKLVVYLQEDSKAPSNKICIDFVTIASTGNAVDFGNVTMLQEINIVWWI